MKEPEMQQLASLLAGAIKGSKVKDAVNKLRGGFTDLQYV
jgi:hypothetical protein